MKETTEHYGVLSSRLDQATSILIAICEEKHIAALSDKRVAGCVKAVLSLVYDADIALTALRKCVLSDRQYIKESTGIESGTPPQLHGGTITGDQLDELTLPLGKALSVLELFVDDLPADSANGGYVAQDLINEASRIAHGWAGFETSARQGGAS